MNIGESSHTPPAAHLVPGLIEELCDYVNENWHRTPIHVASYVMWRLNWIHPFSDGNGRTSRTIAYVVFMVRSECIIPGAPTIPDQVVNDRRGYFDALEKADAAFRNNQIDVSAMESLLGGMLAVQLTSYYESAGGQFPDDEDVEK